MRGSFLLPSTLTGRSAWERAWALLAVFILLSSMLAWSAATARPVLANEGPATHLTFVGLDGSFTADDDITFNVEIRDAAEQVVDEGPDATADVALSLNETNGATLEGTTTVAAVAGVASFSVTVRDVGTAYTFDAVSGSLNQTSSEFDITPGALDAFTVAPIGDQVAGADFDVDVTAYDAHGNVKTDYTSGASLSGLGASPGCAGCTPSIASVSGDHGSLTWVDGEGSATVTAYEATASATITVTDDDVTEDSNAFAVDDTGTLAGFDLQPISSQTAGTSFGITVTAHDAYGNTVDYDGAAELAGLASSPGCAGCAPPLLSADATYGALTWTSGTGTASVTAVDADASATLSVTDGPISDSESIAVGHAATLAGFDLAAIASQTAGVAFGVSATAHDAYGNVMTGFSGPAGLAGLDDSPGCAICNPAIPSASASHGTLSWSAGAGTAAVTAVDATTADTLTIASGSVSDSRTFAVGPGALGGFAVGTISSPKTAGVAFTVGATAYDLFGNLKDDYAGGATVSGNLTTSPGTLNTSGDDSAPIYGAFAAWSAGASTASVTAFHAEIGRTVTVSHGPKSGTSNAFTVVHANAASIAFAVASNDVANPFAFTPIATEVGTPIYSACAPSGGVAPCATTGAGTPSTSVRTIVRDAFGNRVIGPTVEIKNGATLLGSDATDANGIADFGETLSIGAVGVGILTARVATGPTNPATAPVSIAIVNDLEACDNQVCDNNTSNNQARVQKAFGKITTGSDFFTGSTTNVRLSTQFVAGSQVTGRCGNNQTIGDATDMVVAGAGAAGTAPASTMVLVMPKDTLKAFGITSRGTPSFNVCLGAIDLTGSVPASAGWKQKGAGKNAPPVATIKGPEDRFWGTPADCGTSGLAASDPCILLRTKQAAAARAALGMTAAQFAQLGIKDADLVIIIRKGSPWDAKGGSY